MLVTLKEGEIEVAVKRYLAAQGINLAGKAVSVEFTATRTNGGGIRADVSIDEASDIPGFSDAKGDEPEDTSKAAAPVTLAAVASAPQASAAQASTTEAAAPAATEAKPAVKSVKEIAAAAAAVVLPEDTADQSAQVSVNETAVTPAKASVSLFN